MTSLNLDLESPFSTHYITPAQIHAEYWSNRGKHHSLKYVTSIFKSLVNSLILKDVDKGSSPNDRFEFSDLWYELKDSEKLNWYNTLTGGKSVDIKYRRINTILAALRHFQTYQNDDLGLQECFFYDCDRLSDSEIDDLCQSINFGDLIY